MAISAGTISNSRKATQLRFGNFGIVRHKAKDDHRAGGKLHCFACGRDFRDNKDLPVTMDVCCPYCGKSHYA